MCTWLLEILRVLLIYQHLSCTFQENRCSWRVAGCSSRHSHEGAKLAPLCLCCKIRSERRELCFRASRLSTGGRGVPGFVFLWVRAALVTDWRGKRAGLGWRGGCSPLAIPLDFTFLASLSQSSPHSLVCGKWFWNFLQAGLSLEVFLPFSLHFPLLVCHVQGKVLSFLFA